MKILIFTYKVVLLMALTVDYANAYLEPGTVSMLLQGLVAGLMVVATTAGIYWQRLLGFFRRITGKDVQEEAGSKEELKEASDDKQSKPD